MCIMNAAAWPGEGSPRGSLIFPRLPGEPGIQGWGRGTDLLSPVLGLSVDALLGPRAGPKFTGTPAACCAERPLDAAHTQP